MTWRPSPAFDDGSGQWSGGGIGQRRYWWDYPTPLGTPKQQIPYGTCYLDRVTPDGEKYEQPTPCGIWWPWSEHKLQHERP